MRSQQDQLTAEAQKLDRTIILEAESAALELLGKANSKSPIDAQYYLARRAKFLAAFDEMQRKGYSKAVTEEILPLAQQNDPALRPETIAKLRAAGVSQAEITRMVRTPKSEVIRAAKTIARTDLIRSHVALLIGWTEN